MCTVLAGILNLGMKNSKDSYLVQVSLRKHFKELVARKIPFTCVNTLLLRDSSLALRDTIQTICGEAPLRKRTI